jgi:hypothetical protein
MTVSKYVTQFMQLSRYAPNDVDTDEKKQECFLNGLNDAMAMNQRAQMTPTTVNQNVQKTPATQGATPVKLGKICFNYGKPGHFALKCPDRRQPSTPTQGMTTPPNRNGSSTPTQAQQNDTQGMVDQVTTEEAQNVSTMEPGTPRINPILS